MCDNSNVPDGWNDRISSVLVPEGQAAILFWDYDYTGTYRLLEAGTTVLNDDWNDQVSSVIVIKDAECPILFEHYNFQGAQKQMCGAGNLIGFSDMTSSVYVPPYWTINLYFEYGCIGDYRSFGAGAVNVPEDFDNSASSMSFKYSVI